MKQLIILLFILVFAISCNENKIIDFKVNRICFIKRKDNFHDTIRIIQNTKQINLIIEVINDYDKCRFIYKVRTPNLIVINDTCIIGVSYNFKIIKTNNGIFDVIEPDIIEKMFSR